MVVKAATAPPAARVAASAATELVARLAWSLYNYCKDDESGAGPPTRGKTAETSVYFTT